MDKAGESDRKFLLQALKLAKKAGELGSVPIGAIIVDSSGTVIARGYNKIKILHDATAHGEVVCIRKAGERALRKFHPEGTTLYTTLEPCFGCGFFITRTNITRVVWALSDPYKGGMDYLRGSPLLKDDISRIEVVREPYDDMKAESKRLMFAYYSGKGDTAVAGLFR